MRFILAQTQIQPSSVITAIILFLMFGVPVLKALFGARGKGKPTARGGAGTRGRGGPGGGNAGRPRGQYRGPGPGAGPGAGAGGGGEGLTMAERIARARQAQQGGGLATSNRPGAGSSAPRPSAPRPSAQTPVPSASVERARQAERARAAQEARLKQQRDAQARARRAAELRRQEVESARRSMRSPEGSPPAGRDAPEPPTPRRARDTGEIGATAIGGEADGGLGGGLGGDLAAAAGAPVARGLTLGGMSQADLRRVFVLKELLDPPLALREEPDGSS